MNKEKIVIDFAYLTMCAENDYIYETGEAKALLDYITNLQQQNKELHNKIDKAIEYIEKCSLGEDYYGNPVMLAKEDEGKDLLEILKGENND